MIILDGFTSSGLFVIGALFFLPNAILFSIVYFLFRNTPLADYLKRKSLFVFFLCLAMLSTFMFWLILYLNYLLTGMGLLEYLK